MSSPNSRPAAASRTGSSKRLAPPTLFVRPPSRDASTASELKPTISVAQSINSQYAPTRPSLLRQRSTTSPTTHRERKSSTASATWAELQNTLEEVELNAGSSSSVFGAEHSRALEELRKAQVDLARAWARGEGDDVAAWLENVEGHTSEEADKLMGITSLAHEAEKQNRTSHGHRGATAGISDDADSSKGNGGSGTASTFKGENSKLEEETEHDIQLARKRRMANDRYFERVNKGVVDVVAKLDAVAKRMGGVEMESQEIWGETESIVDSDGGNAGG